MYCYHILFGLCRCILRQSVRRVVQRGKSNDTPAGAATELAASCGSRLCQTVPRRVLPPCPDSPEPVAHRRQTL